MKIRPTEKLLSELGKGKNLAILTGVRFGESDVRNRRMALSCQRGGECGQGVMFEESQRIGATYLAPIAFWRECHVWDFINFVAPKWGYPTSGLEGIYQSRSARFGCWTCTVVKQDKTMQRIVSDLDGLQFKPMLEFRNWLVEFAKNPENRVKKPDGSIGRLTLAARQEILKKLHQLERELGRKIISSQEIAAINKLWLDPRYADSY